MTDSQVRFYKEKKYLFLVLIVLAVVSVLVAFLISRQVKAPEPAGKNTHISEYMKANWNEKAARGVPFPAQTTPITLKGSWYDMGQQYGKSSGDYIRIVYDSFYGLFLSSKLDPTKLSPVLDKYMDETKKLSPEMIDFIRGIGDGAAPWLDTADNANALDNSHKIMFINCLFEVVFPLAWPHLAQEMGVELPPQAAVKQEPFASHSWAAWGNMTPGGQGVMGGTRDQPWMPTMYNVAYVAIPSDGRAAVTWTNTIAGLVVASAQVNEWGVGVGNTIVDQKEQYFGVPTILTTAYISFFSHSAKEAADIYTVGTPEYRQKTGRSTLAVTSGFFQAFTDEKEGFVVERTGRNYFVRKTGDQKELGDYIVLANHAVADNSYDEMGKQTGQPMSSYTLAYPDTSSNDRYWTLFHEIAQHKGSVTPELGEKTIATLKYNYTQDGQKVTEKDGVPVWRLGLTPERYLIPKPSDPNSQPTGGNNMYFVTDLKKRDVYWVQGIPSHWEGAWEHVSLGDPAFKR